jgi:hypothetical protein
MAQPLERPAVRVLEGAVTVLRLFDVAYGIDIARVEALAAGASRPRLLRTEPKAMAYGVESVDLALGPLALPAGSAVEQAEARVRLYEFGAVCLRLTARLDDVTWDDYVAAALAVEGATKGRAAASFWTQLLERVRALSAPALIRPSDPGLEEDYLIAVVRRIQPALPADALLEQVDPVPFLSGGETMALSDGARAELLRKRFSYYRDDLALLTWDRALLVEPRGDTDVADVLEVANAQLLELRYYDELLDDELPRMYGRVNRVRGALAPRALGRYGRLARELHTLVAEVTELTERVDNALKVTEDVYLARIYAAALDLFRVRPRGNAVDRKLAIIRDTYHALFDEAAAARAELLEATIVLLIAVEIVLAFFL